MKIAIYTLIIIALHLTHSYSQNSGWLPQVSGVNSELFSVHFEDASTGWVCGSGGVILKTTNGGNIWSPQSSGTSLSLRSIYFISVTTGWCAGDDGKILKTTNGGINWSAQPSGITSTVKCVWFLNSITGYAAGAQGKIIKTNNGGSSWVSQTSGVTSDINSVMFIDNNTGWASGNTGKILKTTNAGSQWVVNIDHGPISDFYGIYFSNSTRGIAVGRYLDQNNVPFVYFYKTDNGGNWWEYLSSGNKKILRSVFFVDSIQGWAVGDSGAAFGTINKGASWIEHNSRTFNGLNSVYFVNRDVGFAVGKNGTIIRASHGGYRDTILTNRRDLGVIPLIDNSSQLLNAKYRVQFKAPDTSYNVLRSLNNGISFDTMLFNISLADTGRFIDGLLLRVKKIKFISGAPSGNYVGNVGVLYDPVLSTDSIQTRFYGWDYFPAGNNPYDSSKYRPNNRPYQSKSLNISYPTRNTYVGFRSLLNPEDKRKVKILFTGYGSGQQAYRFLAASPTNYQYQDMREVPFKVYEIDETDGTAQPRQLNCAFLEFPDGAQDNKWEPTADSLGGKEILYIFNSNYNAAPDPFYTTKNLLIQQPTVDVMYVWAPKRISAASNFQVNDEFYIHPYTVTRPEIAPGYPLYYEFQTFSVIGIEPISSIIPEEFSLRQNYPNPFNPITKIRFDLPRQQNAKIKIFDIVGKEVELVLNSRLSAGEYEIQWDGSKFASGIYFCRLEGENYSYTIKMVLVK